MHYEIFIFITHNFKPFSIGSFNILASQCITIAMILFMSALAASADAKKDSDPGRSVKSFTSSSTAKKVARSPGEMDLRRSSKVYNHVVTASDSK
jgi:hypothetical protein